MLIALIVIMYVMANEYRKRKRVKAIQAYFDTKEVVLTDEQVGKIEASVKHAVKYLAPHWKMQFRGQFNTAKYVEFLEYKYSKGEL